VCATVHHDTPSQLRKAAVVSNKFALKVAAALLFGMVFSSAQAIDMAERQFLIDLYTATAGDGWTNNANWCAGACPATGVPTFNVPGTECTWYGVTCNAGADHITGISLSTNHLVGTLPNELIELSQLGSFYVSSNQCVFRSIVTGDFGKV
jgi:hypothetical protein